MIEPANTKIAVIGGGNIGTQFACVTASKGFCVNLLSSAPELFDGTLEVVDEFENVTSGCLNLVSSDIGEVVDGCSVVFVTYPAYKLKDFADRLLPYVQSGMYICVLPGTGGAEFSFLECIKAGATLIGLQRVPSVARLEKYGKRVRCEGLRLKLNLASIPAGKTAEFSEFLTLLWGIPCNVLPNYLNVTLTPSNPIIHTTRLRTLFADYKSDTVYERNPLFYAEWTDEASALMLACDSELQETIKAIGGMDLHNVSSLKHHYDSETVEALTCKLRSIKSLHNLYSPMKKIEGGWIPDFESRYFAADFPYGLAILEEFADVVGIGAPNIKSTMAWYRELTGDYNRLDIRQYGICSIEDIYAFYNENPA